MSRLPIEYLRHILDEIEYLDSAAAGLSREGLLEDETLKRSFVRSLEIIGEAAGKLSVDFKSQYPGIAWRKMAGMRNRLIHDYFGVDYAIVWDVVKNKLPELKADIKKIVEELDK